MIIEELKKIHADAKTASFFFFQKKKNECEKE